MQKSMHSIGFVYILLPFTAIALLRDDGGQSFLRNVLRSNTHESPHSQIPRGAFILENVAELTPLKGGIFFYNGQCVCLFLVSTATCSL